MRQLYAYYGALPGVLRMTNPFAGGDAPRGDGKPTPAKDIIALGAQMGILRTRKAAT